MEDSVKLTELTAGTSWDNVLYLRKHVNTFAEASSEDDDETNNGSVLSDFDEGKP